MCSGFGRPSRTEGVPSTGDGQDAQAGDSPSETWESANEAYSDRLDGKCTELQYGSESAL